MFRHLICSIGILGVVIFASSGALAADAKPAATAATGTTAAQVVYAQPIDPCQGQKEKDKAYADALRAFNDSCQLDKAACFQAALRCEKCKGKNPKALAECKDSAGADPTDVYVPRKDRPKKKKLTTDATDTGIDYGGYSDAQIQQFSMCPQTAAGKIGDVAKAMQDQQRAIDKLKEDLNKKQADAQKDRDAIAKLQKDAQIAYQKETDDYNKATPAIKQANAEALQKLNDKIQHDMDLVTNINLHKLDLVNKERIDLDKQEQGCYQNALGALQTYLGKRQNAIDHADLTAASIDALFNGSGESRQQKNADYAYRMYQACMTSETYLKNVQQIEDSYTLQGKQDDTAILQNQNDELKQQQQISQLNGTDADQDKARLQEHNTKLNSIVTDAQSAIQSLESELNSLAGNPSGKGQDLKAQLKQMMATSSGVHLFEEAQIAGQPLNGSPGKVGLDSEIGQLNSEMQGRQRALDSLKQARAVVGTLDADKAKTFQTATTNLGDAIAALLTNCYGKGDPAQCQTNAQTCSTAQLQLACLNNNDPDPNLPAGITQPHCKDIDPKDSSGGGSDPKPGGKAQ